MTAPQQDAVEAARALKLRHLELQAEMDAAAIEYRRRRNAYWLHHFVRASRDVYRSLGDVYSLAGFDEDARRWTALANTKCRDGRFHQLRRPKPTPRTRGIRGRAVAGR